MASNYLYLQSENVRQKLLPKWMSMKWNVATDLIERKGEEEPIGERDFRIPFELTNGGRAGAYNPNFGDMGRGSAPTGSYLLGSYFSLRLNFELPLVAVKATQNRKLALQKPLQKAITNAIPEFSMYVDKFWHGDGTPTLATATAHTVVSGASVYTMDTTFGVQRLRRGMYLNVYDSTGATVKSASTLYIDKIDVGARKVTLSGTVPSAASTDTFTFEGVSGANPAGLRGLYYWNSYATSGTTAGINRATEPEIIANSVNANGGLTHEHGMFLMHKMGLRRGEIPDDLTGLANVAQQAQIFGNLLSLQGAFDINGGNKFADRLPKGLQDKSFPFCGVPILKDYHQDQTRIDVISPSTWGRAVLDGMKFYENDGQRFFELRGGSGAPAAGNWFGLTLDMDYYNTNPGVNGVIYGCTLPSLYQ